MEEEMVRLKKQRQQERSKPSNLRRSSCSSR